jgi:hypothetical protein
MNGPFLISYPADDGYQSEALENGVQLIKRNGDALGACSLVSLYVTNAAAATVYLLVSDDAAGPHGLATNKGTIYPIAAEPGDVAIAQYGGEEFRYGIYVGAYTTKALAIAGGAPDAGNVLLIKAGFTGPKFTPV